MSGRKPTSEELDALATLAKRGRILAILIPAGVPDAEIERLTREVNAQLDALVARRGAVQ